MTKNSEMHKLFEANEAAYLSNAMLVRAIDTAAMRLRLGTFEQSDFRSLLLFGNSFTWEHPTKPTRKKISPRNVVIVASKPVGDKPLKPRYYLTDLAEYDQQLLQVSGKLTHRRVPLLSDEDVPGWGFSPLVDLQNDCEVLSHAIQSGDFDDVWTHRHEVTVVEKWDASSMDLPD